uniref:Uncharacterized protein n=1 Tax=Octopus bimaculoides TaxID=37653 RepID=A0A0L8G8Q3_OCTBM
MDISVLEECVHNSEPISSTEVRPLYLHCVQGCHSSQSLLFTSSNQCQHVH